MTTITLDGYTFPEGELPWRGPLIELSEQVWSEQPTLGLTSPGTIFTFMGTKSQPIPFEFRASSATANKLLAIYDARKEVTLITPQNTDGFEVLLHKLKIKHESPEAGSKYLCKGVLVSREAASGATDPGAGGEPSEGEDDVPTIVVKSVDEIVNNSVTHQDDDELFLALGANETWVGSCFLRVAIKAASDFKFMFTRPSGALSHYVVHGDAELSSVNRGNLRIVTNTSIAVNSDDDDIIGIQIDFIVINGATAGNWQLKWAQVAAVAEDTIVEKHSHLIAFKQ